MLVLCIPKIWYEECYFPERPSWLYNLYPWIILISGLCQQMIFAHCLAYILSTCTCLKMVPIWFQLCGYLFQIFCPNQKQRHQSVLVCSPHLLAQVIYSRKLDITTCFGFLVMLYQARRLQAHGCAWYAVPCGSWIYLSFSYTWTCFPPVIKDCLPYLIGLTSHERFKQRVHRLNAYLSPKSCSYVLVNVGTLEIISQPVAGMKSK